MFNRIVISRNLNDLMENQSGIVIGYNKKCPLYVKEYFLYLGFNSGTRIKASCFSPLNDSRAYIVSGKKLVIRKADAQYILVSCSSN
ncbi:MAG: ferrous iron transport protein A [Bacteroidales bacterium]|nr:ferrous iron transport protein A [Bacteroidales bacterium]